jgi:DNA-directed RNA polymerase specialized sigma24 family protein
MLSILFIVIKVKMYSATREEAAEVLGVSVRSVDRYIKS